MSKKKKTKIKPPARKENIQKKTKKNKPELAVMEVKLVPITVTFATPSPPPAEYRNAPF
jgi:hypothetical protein